MEVSNREIDPELCDPVLDLYHCEGASSVRLLFEAQDFKGPHVRAKQAKHVDICS